MLVKAWGLRCAEEDVFGRTVPGTIRLTETPDLSKLVRKTLAVNYIEINCKDRTNIIFIVHTYNPSSGYLVHNVKAGPDAVLYKEGIKKYTKEVEPRESRKKS